MRPHRSGAAAFADHQNGVEPGMRARPGRDALVMSGTVERGSFRLPADLTAAPGQVLGVLGPNGAGKTTLLRALSGLDALSGGSIHLGGLTLGDHESDTCRPGRPRARGLGLPS